MESKAAMLGNRGGHNYTERVFQAFNSTQESQ